MRVLQVFPATYLPRLLSRNVREQDPYLPWRSIVVIAAALALPLTAALFPDAT